uniref:C2H2-type domain-containing protein n=1 Tax=Plectus sambesii TaxID=2011161 RepID=A0A914WTM0_9BILA
MISCPWNLCPDQFDDRVDLKDHVSSAHLKYFPYRCHHCDVIFPSRSQVDYHWSSDHTDQGPPVVSCCLNRQKERCLKEILAPLDSGSSHQNTGSVDSHFSSSSTSSCSLTSTPVAGLSQQQNQEQIASRHNNESQRAISVQLQLKHEVSEFDSPNEDRLLNRHADAEGNGDLDTLEVFSTASTLRHVDGVRLNRDKNHSSIQEQRFTPEFDGTIPEHLVDIAWDMTMKRKALIGAALDARFKYFVAQLAMSIPPMSCKEVGESARVMHRSSLAELLSLQGYPTNEALYSGFEKFAAEVPEDEARKIEMVIGTVQHIKKLCSMRVTRDKRRHTTVTEPEITHKRRRSFDHGVTAFD